MRQRFAATILTTIPVLLTGCQQSLKATNSWQRMSSVVRSSFNTQQTRSDVESTLNELGYETDRTQNFLFETYDTDADQSHMRPAYLQGDIRAGLSGKHGNRGFSLFATMSNTIEYVPAQSLIFRFGGGQTLNDVVHVIHYPSPFEMRWDPPYEHPGDPENSWYVIHLNESEAAP